MQLVDFRIYHLYTVLKLEIFFGPHYFNHYCFRSTNNSSIETSLNPTYPLKIITNAMLFTSTACTNNIIPIKIFADTTNFLFSQRLRW